MYKHIIRPILSVFSPETVHNFCLKCLSVAGKIPGGKLLLRMRYSRKTPQLEREVFGIRFSNPVGLAAGLDRNGDMYNDFARLGFGFVEIGSITPQPQAGNPKPRLFRIPQDKAIVNRIGSENKGVKYCINHLKTERPDTIVAACIQKGSDSMERKVVEDYRVAFSLLYDFVDMFTVNISNPLNDDSEMLQDLSFLSDILDPLLDLRLCYDEYKPILVKVAIDIPHDRLVPILDWCRESGIDGIVAGNASRSLDILSISKARKERIGRGAVSGAPLFSQSIELVRFIHQQTEGRLPIIGVGGIMTPQQAQQMLDAGASLIEVCSGLIYEGPKFPRRILKHLCQTNNS